MKASRIILGTVVLTVVVVLLVYAQDFLCNGQVSPPSGDNWTWFRYSVWWTGEGEAPDVYVHIDDGEGQMMTLYDLGSEAYIYEYYTRLDSGDHGFYFDCEGGRDPNVGAYVGPHVE